MRRDLSISDLTDLLERPYAATLATYRADGTVLLSPVWHEWRDGGFNVHVGGRTDVKARHVARDPRASIVVYDHEPPYRGIEVRGTARLVEQGQRAVGHRIAARYRDTAYADRYVDDFPNALVLRLEPGVVRAWDFRDDVEREAEQGSR